MIDSHEDVKLVTWDECMRGGGIDSYSNYMGGTDHKNMYIVLSKTRDSRCLERANFEAAKARLEKVLEKEPAPEEPDEESEPLQVLSFSHWAVGWIEHILVSPDHEALVSEAKKILSEYGTYPCLDEERWSECEWECMTESWISLNLSERVDLCREYGISRFAARHDFIPESYRLEEYLRGDC